MCVVAIFPVYYYSVCLSLGQYHPVLKFCCSIVSSEIESSPAFVLFQIVLLCRVRCDPRWILESGRQFLKEVAWSSGSTALLSLLIHHFHWSRSFLYFNSVYCWNYKTVSFGLLLLSLVLSILFFWCCCYCNCFFLISFSDCSMQMYRNPIDFCTLTLHPATFLN